MKLWNAVCKTDPKHTKKAAFGRDFTAIDPMYQVMCATRELGVAGDGWGWEIEDVKFLPTDQVCVLIKMWVKGHSSCFYQWGQTGMFNDNDKKKPDNDCMKKATTDGITKCLSYLGFNADVFLGKFDDNKYVEKMKEEFNDKSDAYALWVQQSKDKLSDMSSFEDIEKWQEDNKEWTVKLSKKSPSHLKQITDCIEELKKHFSEIDNYNSTASANQ